MKVTLIASVSANGKVLLANNPNHQIAPEVMEFLVQKAVESGNIVFGYSTYTMFIDALQDALAGKEIVVLSNNHEARSGHKTVHTPESGRIPERKRNGRNSRWWRSTDLQCFP